MLVKSPQQIHNNQAGTFFCFNLPGRLSSRLRSFPGRLFKTQKNKMDEKTANKTAVSLIKKFTRQRISMFESKICATIEADLYYKNMIKNLKSLTGYISDEIISSVETALKKDLNQIKTKIKNYR